MSKRCNSDTFLKRKSQTYDTSNRKSIESRSAQNIDRHAWNLNGSGTLDTPAINQGRDENDVYARSSHTHATFASP
jgi:hypothetical protein